jgi:uncharacterized protein (TIGR03437 family)
VSTPSLAFSSGSPGTAVLPQSFTVASTGSPLSFGTSVQYLGGPTGWLSVTPPSGLTPATITANVDTTNLTIGNYSAIIGVTSGTNQGGYVNVSLSVGNSNPLLGIAASPAALSLTAPSGGASTSQSVSITAQNTFGGTISVSIPNGTPWLSATPQFAFTPALINVTANPIGLSPGIYYGTVSVIATSGYSLSIPVTFNVNPGGGGTGTFSVSPGSLTFNYQFGMSLPPPQPVLVSNAAGAVLYTATTSAAWLLVSTTQNQPGSTQATGITNGTLYVSVNPVNFSYGQYTGTIAITGSNTITQYVQVTLNVGNTPFLVSLPSALSFSWQIGSSTPPPQTLTITSTSSVLSYTATVSNGFAWLNISPATGVTNGVNTITVGVYPYPLAPGNYSGTITVTSPSSASPLNIPVSLTVLSQTTGNGLIFTPSSLSFQARPSDSPTSQTLYVSSAAPGIAFQATTQSGANWLTVSPSSANTPAILTVTANPTILSTPGTYNGQINITSAAGNTNIPVLITITSSTPAGTLTVAPTQLSFNYGPSGLDFPSQTIALNSTGSPISFSAVASTVSGGNWLGVSPVSGTTPASLTVTVGSVSSLSPGTYNGIITISPAGGASATQTVAVTLTVKSPAAAPSIVTILNSATQLPGPISPGEMLEITGSSLGPIPAALVNVLPAGAVDSTISGTKVYFDNVVAPLLYAGADRIAAVVPYELYGRTSTQVHVEVNGVQSTPVSLLITDSSPGIFTIEGTSQGQGKILNQDGSVNGQTNAAAPGSIVSIFATGFGQTTPVGQDGRLIVTDLRTPLLPVSVFIGGTPATVTYAGSAPGFVCGFIQVNAVIPNGLAGTQLPVKLLVGNAVSPDGVTLAVGAGQ